MPVKWNTLKVSDAMDKAEEYVKLAAEPLEQARLAVEEAKKIPNLPQFIEQSINSLLDKIERVTGGKCSWKNEPFEGQLREGINSVRNKIPADDLARARRAASYGETKSLI